MDKSALDLFKLIDGELDYAARAIKNRIFSEYRDMPWTHEQRIKLQPLVRKELDMLIMGLLGDIDNVGCVLPDDYSGWLITDRDNQDIRDENQDYCDMWYVFLSGKQNEKELDGQHYQTFVYSLFIR
ncbi:MAG: hypothetical protein JXA42_08585 [Anaerolineales bacterium]|nr:hypothetical protein [Anaerolineales bacterium]